ncbi:hypothetical protein IEQ34_015393 [Dendrobium chrysotoxum]|uniref:Uncharacterized protein n=1 Tax=Dendrobium chrysotoxum TaxID=161865 RepID=A0AAV7GGZ8_DENCH|nr:hypothetical protein IEQ34_015393 [Dendrobium chrysotoxum]
MYLIQHPRTQPNHGPKKQVGVRSQTGRRTLPRRSLLPEESPYVPEGPQTQQHPQKALEVTGNGQKRCGKCRAPVTCPGAALAGLWGHGGMGKTTFLQHRKFELKMWVCVFINFDAKKVIGDILNSNLDEMH